MRRPPLREDCHHGEVADFIDYPFQVSQQFVFPFYGGMLHANCLRFDDTERAAWVRDLQVAASAPDPDTAATVLDTREWRGRMAMSWMIGMNGWHEFTPDLCRLMRASELTYAGQGYAVGLALLGSDDAVDGLCAYLDQWLPEIDCHYDQHWARAALIQSTRNAAPDQVIDT